MFGVICDLYSLSMCCGSIYSNLGNSNIWTSLEKVIETFLSGNGADIGDKWPVEESKMVCLDDSSGVRVIEIGLSFLFFLASSILLIVSSYKLSVACRWFFRKLTVSLNRRTKIMRNFQQFSKDNVKNKIGPLLYEPNIFTLSLTDLQEYLPLKPSLS